MSSGFTFGANKPAEAPTFGQSTFGSQQAAVPLFGGPTTKSASLPQFSSTFGGGTSTGGFQFSSPNAPTASSTFSSPRFNFNSPTAQPALKPNALNFGSGSTPSQGQNLFGSPSVSTPNTSTLFGTAKSSLSFSSPIVTSFGAPTASTAAPAGGRLFGTTTTTTSSGFPFSLSSATKAGPAFGSAAPAFNYATTTAGANLPFGGPPSATAAMTGATFGTALSAPSSGLGFSTLTSTAPNAGFGFGSTTSAAPTTFGTGLMTQPSTGITFGPTSTAATSAMGFASVAPSTGIAFGTPQTAASFGPTSTARFGQASTGGFGPASTAAPAVIGFNAASPAQNTGLTFGTAAAAAATTKTTQGTGIMFGTPTTTTIITTQSTGLTFGTPTTSKPTGITFGTPTAAATQSTGINFSTGTSAAAPNMGLTFGVSAAAPKLSFSNTPIASAAPVAAGSTSGGGLSFGITKSADPTTSTTAAPTLAFGTSLPSTTSATLSFPTSLAKPLTIAGTTATTPATFGATTITTSSGFGFGQNLASSTTTSVGLGGIKLSTAATTTTSLFNLLSQPTSTTAAITTATSTPQQNVGLGGINAAVPKQPPTGTASAEQAEMAPKAQPLPNELIQTVDHFKKFVQEQKSSSSEIARFSVRELKRVQGDIDIVNNCITEMESELQKNKAIAVKLKGDTARGLQHAEMAQRTFDTPVGLQYDNTTPLNYFIELTDSFEKDMYLLKVYIENIDKCVRNIGPNNALTSQDLALGMRRLHETFVSLAGRLQGVHNQVQIQKDKYLTLRKQLLNDYTNVFEDGNKQIDAFEIFDKMPFQPPTLYTGPTPFNSLGSSQAQALAQNLQPTFPSPGIGAPQHTTTSGFNLGGPSTVPLFGGSAAGTSSLFNTSSSFQLQKPPIGNKRGKQ